MKIFKKVLVVLLLLLIYTYACFFTFLPSSYIMLEGEELNIPTMAGITVKEQEQSKQTARSIGKTVVQTGKINYTLSLFDLINLKKLQVNILPKTSVIPIGKAIRNETLYRRSFSGRNVRN